MGALPGASPEVAGVWQQVTGCAAGDLPAMGLSAGDRPHADVEVLAGAYAAVEYELARRMHAATAAGALPLVGPGAVLGARGWGSAARPPAGPHRGPGRRAPDRGRRVGRRDDHLGSCGCGCPPHRTVAPG